MKIKNLKLKIIFLGSSKFVIPILEILRKNFDLKLVLTTENPKIQKDTLASQGDALRSYPVVKYCVENKIPYRSVSILSNPDLKSLIINLQSPVAVLADFGLIIPKKILNAFPLGIINIHPSLLPKYRGPTPVQTAILNGEKITGVSIMKLDEEIDHGPILGQEKEEILNTDTSESLYKRLFDKGASLLLKLLPEYLNGSLEPIPQNHKEATFTKHLTRQDGFIDVSLISHLSSLILDRMIRAYHPWPGVFTKLKINNKELRIKFLPGEKIQVEGKKPMIYKDFINGYPNIKQQLGKLLGQLA
ncbi:MAG: methionyl-tRNA formyltransferase [bacterium]|nr:methionyl-tRNA formyltransferase [bacterium]